MTGKNKEQGWPLSKYVIVDCSRKVCYGTINRLFGNGQSFCFLIARLIDESV